MDITHHFAEKGQGEALILLHGNGGSCEYFAGQIDEFAKHYHVYAPDTRGHGKTPRGTAPFTIRQFADDLCGFLDAQNIEQAHLLGFSDGGNIALIFAAKYPERVKKLVLNGANLTTAGVKPSVQLSIELGYRFAKLFSGKSAQAKKNAEMLGLMVNSPNIRTEELAAVTAPTLVIAGTKDLIKEAESKRIAAGIRQSELVFLEGDHCIAAEHPEAFNRTVLAFLHNENTDASKASP